MTPILLAALLVPPRDLDFWLGGWKVYVDGQLAGTDTVSSTLNGYAVREVWQGTEPKDTGESFFYYMPAKRQWKQI